MLVRSSARLIAVVVLAVVWGALLVAFGPSPAGAQDRAVATAADEPASAGPVVVRYFYGAECPYCAQQAQEMDTWEGDLPVEIHRYEVWHEDDNRMLYAELAAAYEVEARAVPATFIGPWVWLGFNDEIAAEMRAAIDACALTGCDDPMSLLGGADAHAADADPTGTGTDGDAAAADDRTDTDEAATGSTPTAIRLPLLGTIELASSGLLASTALIAFVDGINPCSLWVLSILLALLVRTGSRSRLAAIGGTFLAVTALVYGLFIAGAFGTLGYAGHLGWIRGVVAVLALVFAAVNIKDYVALKRGPSFTIPDAAKPRIYRGSRRIADLDAALPTVLAATVVMAAGVALVELPCTAGFPVVWSQIVHDAGVGGSTFAGLLGLYLGIYLLDELILLAVVVVTLRISKVQERHVQGLKLVGGTIMLALGVTLIVRPELLHDIAGTLVVFVAAIAGAALIHTTRRLTAN